MCRRMAGTANIIPRVKHTTDCTARALTGIYGTGFCDRVERIEGGEGVRSGNRNEAPMTLPQGACVSLK